MTTKSDIHGWARNPEKERLKRPVDGRSEVTANIWIERVGRFDSGVTPAYANGMPGEGCAMTQQFLTDVDHAS